jgi:hypothetical protein
MNEKGTRKKKNIYIHVSLDWNIYDLEFPILYLNF